MLSWRFGDVTVTRVEESAGPLFDPATFFPDYDAERFHAEAWMQPDFVSADGKMMASMHTWVIRTPRHTVLIDSCVGDDKERLPFRDFHQLKSPWLANLEAAGVRPERVDYVLCTHLHVDHVGWNTRLQDGRWVPTFANARYLFGRAEYAHWESERSVENVRGFAAMSQKVYDDSVLPVMQAGLVDLVGDDHELLDALLRIRLAPGHTPGSITIDLTTPQRRALFTGDILHHPIQVLLPEWNSAFCGAPEQARQTRRRVLEQCAQSQAVLMPAHFGKPHCGHVHRQGDAFSFAPLQADF